MDRIYIPTYKRPDNQVAYNNMPESIQKKVIMVVQDKEHSEGLYDQYDCEKFIVGNEIGIAKTRELIYEHAQDCRFGMIDDDLIFSRRNRKYMGDESKMEKSKRNPMNEQDWFDMIGVINKQMDIGHMHIGNRDTAVPPLGAYFQYNVRMQGSHWVDGAELVKWKDNIDWTYTSVGEDAVLTLECLLHGYKNCKMDEFNNDGWSNTYNEGGCSTYRTKEVEEQEHLKLCDKYPDLVRPNGTKTYREIGEVMNFKFDFKKAFTMGQGTLDKFYVEI